MNLNCHNCGAPKVENKKSCEYCGSEISPFVKPKEKEEKQLSNPSVALPEGLSDRAKLLLLLGGGLIILSLIASRMKRKRKRKFRFRL